MRLTVIRHAEAVAASEGMKDFQRPLSDKGRKEARVAAQRFMAEGDAKPDLLLSSPAVRTMETARIFAAELGYDLNGIETQSRLYPGSLETLEETVRSLDAANLQHVLVFGHNPGISEFAHKLDPEVKDFLPTAGFVTAGV